MKITGRHRDALELAKADLDPLTPDGHALKRETRELLAEGHVYWSLTDRVYRLTALGWLDLGDAVKRDSIPQRGRPMMSAKRRKRRRELGGYLRECRKAAGWTQKDLAQATGVDTGTVSQCELGKRRMHDKLKEWADDQPLPYSG